MTTAIGQGIDRVDGPLKVTGSATYSAEIALPGMTYAALVTASTPSARISRIDTSQAERADGVLAVLTHRDLPKVTQPPLIPSLFGVAAPGETFFPMQDDIVHYAGQPVAIVIADGLERANYAATLVEVAYESRPSVTTIDEGRADAYEPHAIFAGFMPGHVQRGDVDGALAQADHTVAADYRFAANHHNPIETSTTTAVWDGDRLTLYESTQGITATQATVSALLDMPLSNVRVIAHFVGGSFGCKAMVWPHSTLAAMAARHVRRPGQTGRHPRTDVHHVRPSRRAGTEHGPWRVE